MARYTGPVLKRCRALDISPAELGYDKESNRQPKRNNRKMSEYGRQLREKQKAKFIYGTLEKQFRIYFARAQKMQGMTGTNLMVLLETRLDNVVFRLGFGRTRKEARQLVLHNHFTVNGKKVNIPSYRLKAGDVVEIREKTLETELMKTILDVCSTRVTPVWLDKDNAKGTVTRLPLREDIDTPIEESLIVELYSK